MRENKYRAWDTIKKIMHSAKEMGKDQLTLMPDGQGFVNVSGTATWLSVFIKHLIPLQYTNINDKHGKEIYKSDLIKVVDEISEVEWHFNRWIMRSIKTGRIKEFNQIDRVFYEIVGNIHENPELLGE